MTRKRSICAISLAVVALSALGGCPLVNPPGGNDGGSDNNTPPPALTPDDIDRSLVNTSPTASAGKDQTAAAGEEVVLSGAASRDADGDQLFFVWQQIGGKPVTFLGSPSASIVRLQVPEDAENGDVLTFSLTVGDGFAADVDRVVVNVRN